ncbi:MAG TPA: zinc ribbon domain-containing protein [Bacillota bacterium]|nr:zinc ribbon domain-containing protein [Bacillota bacterium]HOH10708.1 zinc ribbon domain-containing protein [Bacillota bacterium]HPI01601.1 zinc ribbon domain-containing protein [Bacillota bacterium]HPM64456.1 zinc ribbon domain-containing protein [Bacillota bacterium]HQJ25265.1 zinc ribbon domain-containing protein [Bacillota bacterium]
MPIFDFKCENCGYTFETLAKRDEQVNCPKCNSERTRKLLSKFGFSCGSNFRSSLGSSDCSGCSSTSCSPT